MILRRSNPIISLFLLLSASFLLAMDGHAAIRYVKGDAAGSNDGTSWTNAFPEVVSAIASAQAGDEIWIARGIYYPDFDPLTATHTGNRSLRFLLKTNVKLFGGFAGNETSRHERNWAANRTILSGDIGQRLEFGDNTQSLCYAPTGTTGILVEGIVFAAGNASIPDLGNHNLGGTGGAAYLSGSVAEFRHCAFVGNYSTYGGAIVTVQNSGSQLTLTNCLFTGNRAVYVGGAISFQSYTGQFTVQNCTIVGNTSSRGAAIGTNTMVNCNYFNNLIYSNTTTTSGWQKVETGNGSPVTDNNILEVPLSPPGTTNQVVVNAGLAVLPEPGPDGSWGTMDDVLDTSLLPESPAVGFGSAARLAADSTDADGDGDLNESMPFDLLHRSRVMVGPPDAGAFEFDGNASLTPELIAPAQNSATTKPVVVSYSLPEKALAGSVKLTVFNANLTRVLTLGTEAEDAGSHTFPFDPADPTGGIVVSGEPIPDGVYTFRITYQNAAGAPPASASRANIRIDTHGPAGGTFALYPLQGTLVSGITASVRFDNWTDAGGMGPLTYQLLIDDAPVSEPRLSFHFDFQPPNTPGPHSFTGRVRDSLGNITDVTIVREVGTAPVIALEVTNVGSARATLHTTVDTHGLPTTVTFFLQGLFVGEVNVPPGETSANLNLYPLSPGTDYSAHAWAWNSAGLTAGDAVGFRTLPGYAFSSVFRASGTLVSASLAPSIPDNATWRTFDAPVVNAAGQVAFVGSWSAPETSAILPSSGSGIFIDDRLIARTDDIVPGFSGATWKSFRAPVLNPGGDIAFIATIQGPRVNSFNDTVVAATTNGALEILAREGEVAPGTRRALFRTFTAVAMQGSETASVYFEARLTTAAGRPEVTNSSERGAWGRIGSQSLQMLFREGETNLPGLESGERLQGFTWLCGTPGSPGHGRGVLEEDGLLARWTLNNGRHLIVAGMPLTVVARSESKSVAGTAAEGASLRLGVPSSNADLSSIVMSVELKRALQPPTRAIMQSDDAGSSWRILVSEETHPPAFASNVRFLSFSDPVHAPDSDGLAFLAKIGGPEIGFSRDALFWRIDEDSFHVIGSEGFSAPGLPGRLSADLGEITSIALPGGGRGPIFTATLKGVNIPRGARPLTLCWTKPSTATECLASEGEALHGKIIRKITVLNTVAGAPGTTRAFNSQGDLVWHASFTDGTSAIIRTKLP